MPVSRSSYLQVQTDLNALTQILSWFEQLYDSRIPKKVWLRCELALAEGFTNAVRHAHKNKPSEVPIEMEVILSDATIEIRIWDCGPPFNLEEKLKNMPVNEENETGGGRGLQLIQKIADSFSYTRAGDRRNCLSIVKFYGDENGSNQRKTVDFN